MSEKRYLIHKETYGDGSVWYRVFCHSEFEGIPRETPVTGRLSLTLAESYKRYAEKKYKDSIIVSSEILW